MASAVTSKNPAEATLAKNDPRLAEIASYKIYNRSLFGLVTFFACIHNKVCASDFTWGVLLAIEMGMLAVAVEYLYRQHVLEAAVEHDLAIQNRKALRRAAKAQKPAAT